MQSVNWFEVSQEGLAELQKGKPKIHIVRELIQNAWDEDIKECKVRTEYAKGMATIVVTDDSPEGFSDLKHSFTLFSKTDKRKDPTKRGRFNVGEKQAFSLCKEAIVRTTKGTVTFNEKGRFIGSEKEKVGTVVIVRVSMSEQEFEEINRKIKLFHPPENIKFTVNDEDIPFTNPWKIITAPLTTENEDNGVFRRTQRKTNVFIYKESSHQLYEMGIPVAEIDCEYSLDVQQKVPLSIDRDTVLPSFMKDLFAEVLNSVHEDIPDDGASEVWVREAMGNKRVSGDAIKTVIKKRYGDKVVIGNPFDKQSIDEAISRGVRVVYGSEMSKEEWDNVKAHEAMQTSSEVFGAKSFADARVLEEDELTENQIRVRTYVQKIAKRILNIDLNVVFVVSPKASCQANYGGHTLTFNVSRLPREFFEEPVSAATTDLGLHELGHEDGLHTEKCYHELLTRMAGELVMIALGEPEFFKL